MLKFKRVFILFLALAGDTFAAVQAKDRISRDFMGTVFAFHNYLPLENMITPAKIIRIRETK